MPELYQVLGGILKDISEARVTSDVFSRDASLFYRKDSLLRRFPVPRVDIDEIDIELKFAISEVRTESLDDPKLLEERIQRVFDGYSEETAQMAIEALYSRLRDTIQNKDRPEWQKLDQKLNTDTFREDLENSLLDFFRNRQDIFTEEEATDNYRKSIGDISDNLIEKLVKDQAVQDLLKAEAEESKQALENLEQALRTALKTQIASNLRYTVDFIRAYSQNFKVDVDVSADRLQQKHENTLSTIKFKATLRNYVWTRLEQKGGKVIRQLVPE